MTTARIQDERLTEMFIGSHGHERTRDQLREVITALRAAYAECDMQATQLFEFREAKVELDARVTAHSERSKAVAKARISRGERCGGSRPFGFGIVNNALTPIPAEQRAIVDMVRMYNSGKGTPTIAAFLDAEHVSTVGGGRWSAATVAKILQRNMDSPAYEAAKRLCKQMNFKRAANCIYVRNNSRTHTAPTVKQVVSLRRHGVSVKDIARRVGLNVGSVNGILRRSA